MKPDVLVTVMQERDQLKARLAEAEAELAAARDGCNGSCAWATFGVWEPTMSEPRSELDFMRESAENWCVRAERAEARLAEAEKLLRRWLEVPGLTGVITPGWPIARDTRAFFGSGSQP